MEQSVAAEAAVEDDHRVVRECGPHPAGQREFAGARRAHGGRREQMLAQAEERDQAHMRIARAGPIGPGRPPEGEDILGGIGDAQRGAVEAVDGQPVPPLARRHVRGPRGRGLREQRGQWGGAKLIPRLHSRGIAVARARTRSTIVALRVVVCRYGSSRPIAPAARDRALRAAG